MTERANNQNTVSPEQLDQPTQPDNAPKDMPHWQEMLILVVGELAFAALAIPLYIIFVLPRYSQGALPGFVPPIAEGINPVLAFVAALATCAAGVGLVLVLVRIFGPEHFTIKELDELIDRASYTDFALIYIAAGIGEEMLFRVVLQDLFGLLPAAFFFTIFHAAYWKKPVMLFDVFVLALLLGALYAYTQSFWLCAAVHAIYNFIVSVMYKKGVIPR